MNGYVEMMRRLRTNRSDARLALCGEAIERIAEMEIARTPKEAAQSEIKKKTKKAKKAAGMDGSSQVQIVNQSKSKPQSKPTNRNQNQNQNQPIETQTQSPTTQESEATNPTNTTNTTNTTKNKKKKKENKSKADDGFKVVRKGSNAASFAKNAKIAAGYSMFYDPYESEEEESGGMGASESRKQKEQTRLDGEIASSMMMETDEWTG